jgi:hypothetical protein
MAIVANGMITKETDRNISVYPGAYHPIIKHMGSTKPITIIVGYFTRKLYIFNYLNVNNKQI